MPNARGATLESFAKYTLFLFPLQYIRPASYIGRGAGGVPVTLVAIRTHTPSRALLLGYKWHDD